MPEDKKVQDAFDEFDRFIMDLPDDIDHERMHGEIEAYISLTRDQLEDVLFERFLDKVSNKGSGFHFIAKNTAAAELANARQKKAEQQLRDTATAAQAAIDAEKTRTAAEKARADAAEAAASSAPSPLESPISPSIYAQLDISQGIDDEDAIREWQSKRVIKTPDNPDIEMIYEFNDFLSVLARDENIGFDITKNFLPNNNIRKQIEAYFRTKYLTELPQDNDVRIPASEQVQKFLRAIYGSILSIIQSYLRGNRSLSADEIQFISEMGIDISPLKDDEALSARMDSIRAALKDINTYTKNPTNKTNVERMAQRAYSPFEKTKTLAQARGQNVVDQREARNKAAEAAKEAAEHAAHAAQEKIDHHNQLINYLIDPFAAADVKRPATYLRGLVWDWTTKPLYNLAKKYPGGAGALGFFAATGFNPLGAAIGYGAVKIYQSVGAKKEDAHH